MWAYEAEVVADINDNNRNSMFLNDAVLHPELRATSDLTLVSGHAELLVTAAPSHVMRGMARQLKGQLADDCLGIVSVSKGLDAGTFATMSDVLSEEVPEVPNAALSGPSFAREVYEGKPTAVVVASSSEPLAVAARDAFASSVFRVYTSSDVIGVEYGGALKNVIAIAAGIVDGLELGYNPRAALITRGLAEISRLAVKRGANAQTFAGLAGMGDLILTCTGPLSRNHSLGIELARGRTLDEVINERRTVAEGVRTTRVVAELARSESIEMPVTEEVYKILFENKKPSDALGDLMERELKSEH